MNAALRSMWDRFWFSGGSAVNLAGARIVVATQALWVLLSRDLASMSGLPPVFFSTVPTGAQWRYLIFPGHAGLERVVVVIAVAALTAAILGWHARPACFVAGILLYHLAPYESIIWLTSPYARGLTATVLILLVLAASPCGDRLAISRAAPRPRQIWEYAWPLKLAQLFVAQIYLFSGLAKLMRTGVGWAGDDSVRRWILYMVDHPALYAIRAPGLWLADRHGLVLIGAFGLLVELGFIASLFSRTARRVFVPLAAFMHIAILITMSLTFVAGVLLLIFVNWEWLRSWVAGRLLKPIRTTASLSPGG